MYLLSESLKEIYDGIASLTRLHCNQSLKAIKPTKSVVLTRFLALITEEGYDIRSQTQELDDKEGSNFF
jgi:hypothetical protein